MTGGTGWVFATAKVRDMTGWVFPRNDASTGGAIRSTGVGASRRRSAVGESGGGDNNRDGLQLRGIVTLRRHKH